jgi:AcrR family transcriptional regulator
VAEGLRDRKKARTRERLADVAAALFAEHGYDQVSVADVARAADVSDQTVYNYFPAKHDLVLDRAEEIRLRYDRLVRERPDGTTPAEVVRTLVHEDVDRLRTEPPALARGEFAALCLRSPVLRRYALEFRERQTETVAAAVVETAPGVDPLVAHAHAAALVAVVQWVTDQVGALVLRSDGDAGAADRVRRSADIALDDLGRHFRSLAGPLR